MVYENPDGTLLIYDWKRCKEIVKENLYGAKALTACIRHLDDTNFWHYALQLNTYKAIIEEKYGRKVVGLCLVCLHPNNADYQLIPVPFLEKEMVDLFTYRKQMLAEAKDAHEKKTSSKEQAFKQAFKQAHKQAHKAGASSVAPLTVAPKGASKGKGLLLDLNNL
jgi:hydroxymethylpyrimidine pyrophosphatase-like HAD family hydrolase